MDTSVPTAYAEKATPSVRHGLIRLLNFEETLPTPFPTLRFGGTFRTHTVDNFDKFGLVTTPDGGVLKLDIQDSGMESHPLALKIAANLQGSSKVRKLAANLSKFAVIMCHNF